MRSGIHSDRNRSDGSAVFQYLRSDLQTAPRYLVPDGDVLFDTDMLSFDQDDFPRGNRSAAHEDVIVRMQEDESRVRRHAVSNGGSRRSMPINPCSRGLSWIITKSYMKSRRKFRRRKHAVRHGRLRSPQRSCYRSYAGARRQVRLDRTTLDLRTCHSWVGRAPGDP